MSQNTILESDAVARKKKQAAKSDEPAKQLGFDRVEFQAPPSWVIELDRIAEAMGQSRSSYIRRAVNQLMAEDRKHIQPPTRDE